MNKPEYFYELACCNCPEKDRCLEQKEKKESLINALFSYIENESNKITIGEIKNQIPTLTRCDVVLGKQLQRLKEENEKLKKEVEIANREKVRWKSNFNNYKDVFKKQYDILFKYKQALEEVRKITKKYYLSDKKLLATGIEINPYGAIIEIQDKINEVLKDE